MDFLVGSTEFLCVFLNELFGNPWPDSAIPDRLWIGLQEDQLAAQRSELTVERFDIAPFHHAGTNAVREVQRVDDDKAPWAAVLLNTLMQPLQHSPNAVKVLQIRIGGQRAAIFRPGQRAVGMRLRQVNHATDFSGQGGTDVTANQSVDERRFADPRRAFHEQSLKGFHAGHFSGDGVVLPATTAQAAAV